MNDKERFRLKNNIKALIVIFITSIISIQCGPDPEERLGPGMEGQFKALDGTVATIEYKGLNEEGLDKWQCYMEGMTIVSGFPPEETEHTNIIVSDVFEYNPSVIIEGSATWEIVEDGMLRVIDSWAEMFSNDIQLVNRDSLVMKKDKLPLTSESKIWYRFLVDYETSKIEDDLSKIF